MHDAQTALTVRTERTSGIERPSSVTVRRVEQPCPMTVQRRNDDESR